MRQRKRRIDSWRFSRNWQIKENGQWTRIHERFGKTSIEVTKRGILTNGDYKKMGNVGENENFGKNGEFKGLGPCTVRPTLFLKFLFHVE